MDVFNEYEALTMIPTIIKLYKKDLLLESEKNIISNVYGSLWSIIEEEVHRKPQTKVNPVLKTIFDLLEFLRSKQPILGSDTEQNTVRMVPKSAFRKLNIRKFQDDSPSQRLLNLMANLIRATSTATQHNVQQKSSRRILRSAPAPKVHLNLELSDIPITQVSRTTRHALRPTEEDDLTAARMDATLLKLLDGEAQTESFEAYDDYGQPLQKNYFGVDEKPYDYAFDDHSDYNMFRPSSYSRSSYENNSIADLLKMMARDRVRSKKLNRRIGFRH